MSLEEQKAGASLYVSLSRHHFEKRLPIVLRGFELIKREQAAGLVLFGDGPSRASVEKLAAQIGNVHVAGLVKGREPLARALASADALLHGSAAETFGLAVAEGMSAGLPAVLPDRGAVVDFTGGGNAEAYKAGSPEELARAAQRLLKRRPLGALKLSGSRESSQRSLSQHFEHLFSVYSEIVGSTKTASRSSN